MTEPRRYIFSEEERRIAKAFAGDRLSTDASKNCYGNRGNDTRRHKLFSDIANGALAEMAAYHLLVELYPNAEVVPPDFTVYAVKNKSFDPDITLFLNGRKERVKTHVKSFFKSRYVDFAPSFCFQKVRGRRHTDKDLSHLKKGGDATDLLVSAMVYDSHFENGDFANADPDKVGDCCDLYGPYAMQDVEDESLWKPPYIAKLAKTKRVLYLEDLQRLQTIGTLEVD